MSRANLSRDWTDVGAARTRELEHFIALTDLQKSATLRAEGEHAEVRHIPCQAGL